MIRKSEIFAYGIKLIATWMLIPFIVMFIPMLAKEFSVDVTTQEVQLKDETYSGYPDEILCFNADIDGREISIFAPVTSKTGDTVTVILRDGSYYMTSKGPEDIETYTTFAGRFKKICKNNFGYHAVAIGGVLLATFLMTFSKRKDIREECSKISKVTDITGLVCSLVMSAGLLYGVMANTFTSLGIAYLGLMLGIGYTAIFGVAWIIRSLVP